MKSGTLRLRLLRLLLAALGHLSFAASQRLGSLAGLLLWYSRGRMALVTRENLQICYPALSPRQRSALGRASLMETGKTIFEAAIAWTAPPERSLAAIVEVIGKHEVDEAIALGRGVIFVIPHLGNWEIVNHYLGRHYGLTHMYRPHPSAPFNATVQAWRSRSGTRFVPTNRDGIKAQLTALRNGLAIGAMPDLEPDVNSGKFARFFGVPCLSSTLIPRLAARTGARVVLTSCRRLETGRGFRVAFEPLAMDNRCTGSILQSLNDAIETVIRQAPGQYLWSYKRFRTRPAGEQQLYQFRQHPLRVAVESAALHLGLASMSRLPLDLLRRAGALLGELLTRTRNRYIRQSRANLRLCGDCVLPGDGSSLARESLIETGKCVMEAGKVWQAGDGDLDSLISTDGTEYLMGGPAIILTPPLGNREVLMRYLGSHHAVTEYYHPKSHTALDDLIRRHRTGMGISLVPHTSAGVATLLARLGAGELVTLCPDQQPRPGWGEFVSFFGVPALTPAALATLVRESDAAILIGAAIRNAGGFRVMFAPCILENRNQPDACILAQVNSQLERTIRMMPGQYRWSDKRFNIRPPGEPGIYARGLR